ncbi:L-amino acid amidase [Psilocybe cubensis]|uniref:AB hydrolase-1 domain-containing protein n=2 Tax=Psilocybe cubensis TaxID=181762 RepID=A0A8H8CKZ2_PSICU|nr:L-amino acid amidase [Psilocybe cubensis]KAH9478942.1 L-amino acid amidase [Psilocybe cubensis]
MSEEHTGKVDFKVGSDTFQTWYKIYGDLKSSAKRPLVILHGGPGMTHHYMLPHKSLYFKAGIPVVFYDQLGNGESSHCKGVSPDFWTPELFMDELDNLLKALKINDDFDLLGQSWGGMLAGHYAAARSPPGLKRLIIANSPASMALTQEGTAKLLDKFPPEFVAMVRKHEAEGTCESPEYQAATMQFYQKHICTLNPWPEELNASFGAVAQNPTVYSTMVGPSEFNVIGSLKTWSIVDILHKITNQTLLISSPEDEIQECAVLPFFTQIPKVKWVELQNSTHLAMFEEPERYIGVILNFLENTSA